MTVLHYVVVEHDGGWAYKLGDVFSETFPSHGQAEAAAKRAAEEQKLAGTDEAIAYQDEKGEWHEEFSRGSDRPEVSAD